MVGDGMTFAEELEELLVQELEALKKLRDIAFEKTDIIVGNKVEELEKTIKIEEALINEVGLLEVGRIKLLDTWGVGIDTPISELIERIPEDKEKLSLISNDLGQVLEELDLRNKLNNDLIRENLDWIDFNMNLLTSTETPTSYGKDNKEDLIQNRNSIFDRKV